MLKWCSGERLLGLKEEGGCGCCRGMMGGEPGNVEGDGPWYWGDREFLW